MNAVFHRIEKARDRAVAHYYEEKAEMAKQIETSGATRAMENMLRDVVIAEKRLWLWNEMLDAIRYMSECPSHNEESIRKSLVEHLERQAASLLDRHTWMPNSTCPIHNVIHGCEAEALAQHVRAFKNFPADKDENDF